MFSEISTVMLTVAVVVHCCITFNVLISYACSSLLLYLRDTYSHFFYRT